MTLAVLIMAGGSGTRLWPISRSGRAKQFAQLVGHRTLLEQTYERIKLCLPGAVIFVNVTAGNEAQVHRLLPTLPPGHVISAPEDRDTLPTLGFATLMIERLLPSPTLLLVASDNWIGDAEALRPALKEATQGAELGPYLVSIGVRPSSPSTQYGYMHFGEQAPFGSLSYFGLGYVEKPDAATAANLIEGGRHDWNSGMFAWTADTFWQAVREFSPCSADVFDKLRKSTCPDLVGSTFASLPRLAVDKGILEHVGANTALRHLFVRADVEWDDIGHYAALEGYLSADSSNNRIAGPLTVSDSTGNTLICEGQTNLHVRGVKDLIVVSDSGDLLVASRASYARVRDLAMTDLWSGGSSPGSSNAYSGFVKSVGSEGCVVQSDGNGIVALLDVKDIEVRVYDGGIVVSSRRPTDEAAPISDTAGRGLSASTRLTITEDELRMSQLAAEHVVASIGSLLASGRQPLVMFSAGRTPQGLFKLLRSRYRTALDWSRVRVAQMDEFVGVRDSQSYATFLREELTEPLGVGQFLAIDRSWDHGGLAGFERSLLEDGLDLVVHGIGCNGHLGFNEPGSPFNGKSKIAALAAITRQRAVASFGTLGNVPEAGYTLGLQVLNSASEVVLMAASEDKSIALRNALFGSIDDRVPASSLQTHPRVSVYADRFAASSWLR